MKNKNTKGFTLIELTIVIALIALLSAFTVTAINPSKSLADSRNAQRSSNVSEILNALTQYTSDQNQLATDFGVIPLCSATPAHIGSANGNINLSVPKLVDKYIVNVPTDPNNGSAADTGYTICQTSIASGRITIAAPKAENGYVVSLTR